MRIRTKIPHGMVISLLLEDGLNNCLPDSNNWLSGNLVGISINLCKSIQKELFINDTP